MTKDYFNRDQTDYRITTCCQFHDASLKKQMNIGTCTKTNALKDHQKATLKAVSNCKELIKFMNYFAKQPVNLRSFRISSTMFPCFTVPEINPYYEEVWEEINKLLKIAGNIAIENKIRLSMHPDQFCVLASNRSDVVKNSIDEMHYHGYIGEMLGIEPESFSINIHLQGKYGIASSEPGIQRFVSAYQDLNDYCKKAISVENEDKPNGYDIYDTLELAQRIPIRCTLDIHHYECWRKKDCEYPSVTDDFFKEAVKTWKGHRPLFHKSQSIPGEPRINSHSDIYYDEDRMSRAVPMLEYADFDIEAKHKEVAVKHFYNFIKEEEEMAGEFLVCKTL